MKDGKCHGGVLAMAAALALLPAFAAAQPDDSETSAAGIRNRAPGFEAVPGGPGKRIILKPEMVRKLGVETAPLREGERRAVPCGAIFYDAKGDAWIFVSRKAGVFAGQRVQVAEVADGLALLSDAPPAGTPVVTAGAAALNGAGMFGR